MKKTISSLRAVLITIKNKKTIMKVGLMIMAITTMITMNACSKIDNETANDVCAALAEKYGEDFVAVKIGDRFNTDHAKLYIYPINNESLLFTATINKDTKLVEDDYIIQRVNNIVDNTIAGELKKQELTGYANCCVVTREPIQTDIVYETPKAFQEEYKFENFLIYLCVSENNLNAKRLYDTIKNSVSELGVTVRYRVYVFKESDYKNCVEKIKTMPDANATAIEKFTPIKNFWVDVNNDDISLSEEYIDNILQEG